MLMLKKKKKEGLKQPSAEGRGWGGRGARVTLRSHSCCQLLSQESRYPGRMRRRPGCPLNPVLALEPRWAPLLPPRSSAICGPPYSDRDQGSDAGLFHPMFSSPTTGTRMFHPASPPTVSPASPNPRPTALPGLGHPMNN